MQGTRVIRFKTYNTRRNLPPETGRKRNEANFLGAFERFTISKVFAGGCGGRHFALSNYGVADFVWLVPRRRRQLELGDPASARLYAFETKIKDWRKAFQQAYRYSYYSDASYVVLPPEAGAVAKGFLPLFETCNIGLWVFHHKADRITKVFEPDKSAPRSPDVKRIAVEAIASRL